jgi:hypothetical protein
MYIQVFMYTQIPGGACHHMYPPPHMPHMYPPPHMTHMTCIHRYLEEHVIAKERHRESAIGSEETAIRDLLHSLTDRQDDRGVGESHHNVLVSHLLTPTHYYFQAHNA